MISVAHNPMRALREAPPKPAAGLRAGGLRTSGEVLHVGARPAAAAIIAAIDGARHAVDAAVFILGADGTGAKITEALLRAARRGVDVRLVVDGMGTRPLPGTKIDATLDALRGAGAIVQITRPFSHVKPPLGVDHRKAFVVDDTVSFIGGANFFAMSDDWVDFTVQRSDPAAARQLHARLSDRASWMENRRVAATARPASDVVLESDPKRGIDEIGPAATALVRNAKDRVAVVSPMLTNRAILDELVAAQKRGVDVTAVFSGAALVGGAGVANAMGAYVRTFVDDLVRAGGRVVGSSKPVHAKAIVADNTALVGSWNLTVQGAHRDVELATTLSGSGVGAVHDHIADLAAHGRPVSVDDVSGRAHRVLDGLVTRLKLDY